MKKTVLVVVLVVIALGVFTGVAAAQTSQQNTGLLHEYMEKALAEKLSIPLATVEAQFDSGKSLYQIALASGITQGNLPALMTEVRTNAIKAAVADGIITQAQADRMLQTAGRGMGYGLGYSMTFAPHASAGVRGSTGTGTGIGPCGGTGIPAGTGMHRGGHWQQVNP